MPGTKIGGQKAAATNKAKDPLFFAKIGAKGGKKSRTGGFFANRELAREAGRKGGLTSRRGPSKHKVIEMKIDAEKRTFWNFRRSK